MGYFFDEPVQDECRHGGEQADKETKYQCKLAVGDVLFAQPYHALHERKSVMRYFFFCACLAHFMSIGCYEWVFLLCP